MKFSAATLYVTLVLVFILSCSKGTDTPDPNPPPPPPPPPVVQPAVLSSIKIYKLSGPTDTILKVLEYDQTNRITKIREYKNGTEIITGTAEIKFAGNKIISLYTSSAWPNTNTFDTIELDAYSMPIKRTGYYIINENSAGNIWKAYHFQTTLYSYLTSGEYNGEITYVDDSVYFQTSSQFLITKRLDTITNEVIMENDNIKTLKKTSKNNQWQWNYGVLNFTRTTLTDETDYLYAQNYPNHPVNQLNYLNFIYSFYYPYAYFNNRKNFKNLPDKFVYRNSGGTMQINYTVTYTDKGYIKSIQSDVPADPKYEFFYK